ncbi:MAG: arylsulfatase [Kiritimatiellia bacterium]|nr:arylsulfatase [Kiritimatiellia bacterium]MDP6848435.1 arylsulfatase [Kiritimatiellia bacterium]
MPITVLMRGADRMLNRRNFIKMACAGSVLSASGGLTLGRTSASRHPNVILVMTDDQGHGDLACHGNPVIKTPFMDKLFAQSVRLTDFHVSPCCTPTRASLMTGNDAVRTGAWGTTWGRSLPRSDDIMMSDVFGSTSYKTGFFGKWHLGDNYPFRPEDRGFQDVLRHGGGGVGQTPDYWGNDYFDDTYFHNGKAEEYAGYCTDVWFDSAMRFMEKNKDRPFFCYLATNAPHSPFRVASDYSARYAGKSNVPNAAFYGMITNIDDNLGRLMAKLRELDLEENTILIFLTDNGTAAGFRGGKGHNSGMKGTKGSIYEGGHRVPCFVRWPAKGIEGGRDIGELSAHIDLLPTLIELCNLEAPQGTRFDGVSLAPLLTRKTNALPERSVFVQYSQTTTPPVKWRSAVLRKKWRLVSGKELYDVSADQGQKTNVAEKHPAVVESMRRDYEEWWAEVSKRFRETCDIVVGSDHENPTALNAFDWHTSTPWNQGHIRSGARKNGFWAIEVERNGAYEISLRRWPLELDKPITAAVQGGRALPVHTARLKVGDIDRTQEIEMEAHSSVFEVNLKAGKTHLQTWFLNEESKELCGAYYVYVRKK